ncbi:hypothetical protein C8Q75DRAFT_774284 [Abortiporus biennis]|nr:hypothetical protein C8Q75DRAFT_774284 [Abortiporus biennis]
MSYSVHVSDISAQTTEQHLHDFFTFCGTITSINFTPDTHTAIVNFEKPQAAKTALMLNGGTLDGAHLVVKSDDEKVTGSVPPEDHGEPEQSDKPRAGIAAEYLARGYELSDQILQRAIELDNQHGISHKFLSYIQNIDTTLGAKALGPEKTISGKLQESVQQAQTRARTIDQEKGYSKIAGDYYLKALSSPLGQRVKSFYTTTSKQIFDIHEEAKRIAAHKHHAPAAGSATTATGESAAPTEVKEGGKTGEAPTVV